ncbi:uncharacterized protein LOC117650587 [Thrips palmi]|uniref:Uncharacterized protein LOC117650587 n=1 Tax=Thrips palmi TaxID=161013 RepID=A0A6P8ZZ63_THRPL|nr:uncharacterized protein LOC117650587 [Thrips palmi]
MADIDNVDIEEVQVASILALEPFDGMCEAMTDTSDLLDGLADLDGHGSDSDETLVGSPDYSAIFPMDGLEASLEDAHHDVCFHDSSLPDGSFPDSRLGSNSVNTKEYREGNSGERFQVPLRSSDDGPQCEQSIGWQSTL